MWILAATFSAGFAGLTAILAKCGIQKTNKEKLSGKSLIGLGLMCVGTLAMVCFL